MLGFPDRSYFTKYRKRASLWCTVKVGVFVGLLILIIPFTNIFSNKELNPATIKLCSMKDPSSYVWSHRGHVGGKVPDGSREAIIHLMSKGIKSFDVDVVALQERDIDTPHFLVAHPSVVASAQNAGNVLHLLRLADFLQLISEMGNNGTGVGTITLEPKFESLHHLQNMVEVAETSNISTHIAIIANTFDRIFELKKMLRNVGLAAAYRSQGLTSQSLRYPYPADATKVRSIGEMSDADFFAQIDMPDINLFLSSGRSFRGRRPRTIAWVVDNDQSLWTALSNGLDGVITNEPEHILFSLNLLRSKHCN
jgi:hypothetical protein